MADASRLRFAARYSATEMNKSGGKLLDRALEGAVQITRRAQHFVLLREDHLAHMIEDARDGRPKSLDDLLQGYDAGKLKRRVRRFLDEPPAGKERI